MKKTAVGSLIFLFILVFVMGCQTAGKPSRHGRPGKPMDQASLKAGIPYIDGHNHLFGGMQGQAYFRAARSALEKMDQLGIPKMIIMPPPRVPGQHGSFDVYDLFPVIRKNPDRFVCLGGGGTLNVMIHQYKDEPAISPSKKTRFREQAMDILSKGAVGFGEFSVVHFSLNHNHPYESVPADHPLFLLLADLAAEVQVPIDIHMEAVPRDMPLPKRNILLRSGLNPKMLKENVSGFERLLAHNRQAKIIWAHMGWCNTGYRTHTLCRTLLKRHSNLYMSIKLSPESVAETRMIRKDRRAIRSEWLALMQDYPDRFFIGTDQFYSAPGGRKIGPQKTEATRLFMNLLPPDLAREVGVENPRRIFKLGRK